MINNNKIRITMFGPHLSAKSGISNVINNWIGVGLHSKIDLKYIHTLKKYENGRYIQKLGEAFSAYIRFIFSRSKTDIAHIHLSTGASFFRKLIILHIAKIMGIKTIIHLHGSNFENFYYNNNTVVKKMIHHCFDTADAVIVLSESWRKFIHGISSNKKVFIIYNGANLNTFRLKVVDEKNINITFMGRLCQRKGVYDLLQAFEKINHVVPNAVLILGGDGDIEKVKAIIAKKKITNINVLGWIKENKKIQTFRECDIYVLPSYNEGLPGSILEAMAIGVPILSTPVGGIPEAVFNDKNGFLVPPGDPKKIAEKLLLLCKDIELRQQMGIESRKIMKKKFDIRKIVDNLVAVYNEVLL